MKILVTAFGPFAGRAENASSLAVHGLKRRFPDLRTRIFPVDSVIAPSRLKQALKTIRPDALVMLGEAAGSRYLRLETTAWNEMDFAIPDIAGRQPRSQAIHAGGPESLKATLPILEIHSVLAKTGHRISQSHDAGRYLCNQLFYTALQWLKTRDLACQAGFIHLPLSADCPTDESVEILLGLIELLPNLALGIQGEAARITP
jgi:pyroglutamyl-peptidase